MRPIGDEWNGILRCDREKVACRSCHNCVKGGIAQGTCLVYYDIEQNAKPDKVYFDNAPCPNYVEGEDLLPYEIIL